MIDSRDPPLASGVKLPLQLGRLSDVGNVFGFSGYVYNVETVRGLGSSLGGSGVYTIRFRHYDSGLGRWLQRDPAGYVDGMSLYEYVSSAPLTELDPLGLYRFSRDPEEDRRIKDGIPELDDWREGLEEGAEWAEPLVEGFGTIAIMPALIGVTFFIPGPDEWIMAAWIYRGMQGTKFVTRVHFTTRAGYAAIMESGVITSGYVTKPFMTLVRILLGARVVEWLLRIDRGKGIKYIKFRVRTDRLLPPRPGDKTRLGAPQERLAPNTPIRDPECIGWNESGCGPIELDSAIFVYRYSIMA